MRKNGVNEKKIVYFLVILCTERAFSEEKKLLGEKVDDRGWKIEVGFTLAETDDSFEVVCKLCEWQS